MIKIVDKIKAKGIQLVEEARQELNSNELTQEKKEEYSKNHVSERMKKIMDTYNEDSISKSEPALMVEKEDIREEYSPCVRCQINDLCKKAYCFDMPEYDTKMFDVSVECRRIIEMESVDSMFILEEISKGDNILPCNECAIGDICSKANSLVIPTYDKEMFTIKANCKRFIKN